MARKLDSLAGLIENARFEVIPTRSIEEKVVRDVPTSRVLAVTASSSRGLETTIDLTERLVADGYHVVPHLSARLVVDDQHLKEVVDRLVVIGVDDVFVPAGDADPPVGKFDSTLSLLTELDNLGHPFRRVGITGYPENHPKIVDDVTIQAMWDKRRYANYIVSNLCFDPGVYRNWVRHVRATRSRPSDRDGSRRAGRSGEAPFRRSAGRNGVGDADAAPARPVVLPFLHPGCVQPIAFFDKAAPTLNDPASRVTGLHVFTFNQIDKTEAWRDALLPEREA